MKPIIMPSIEDVTLPGILYALGDPTRLQIALNLFNSHNALTCMAAVAGIDDLAVSSRSHHFGILRQTGIIHSEKKGRETYNSLRIQELEAKFPHVVMSILKSANNKNDN
jgi:DNA-binding transcriptional ArsR family regulator